MAIEIEDIYQLIYRQDWEKLLDVVHKNAKIAANDPLIAKAVQTFEDYFFNNIESLKDSPRQKGYLEKLYLFHVGKIYRLPQQRFELIVSELVSYCKLNGDLKAAYDYALGCPDLVVCSQVINDYSPSARRVVDHSRSGQVIVTENEMLSCDDHRISLFKSAQEREFFMAVREAFPMHTVYPNVALSCLVDFNSITHDLAKDERDYYFKAVVDCVVFDHHNDYIPLYFFELDSDFHDSSRQAKNDVMKNRILSFAGQTLFRIRTDSATSGRKEFSKLLQEVLGVSRTQKGAG